MKQSFTKLLGAAVLLTLAADGFTAKAQTVTTVANKTEAKADGPAVVVASEKSAKADADTAWHPVRRLWGYAIGDLYYDQHADATNRGAETMYNGVPANRNSFQFRRIYLGYDYDISRRFTAEVLLASEPNANTGVNGTTAIQNGDNLVDGKMGFFIKNFNLRYRNIWNGTDLVFGEMSTPGFALNEPGTNAPTSLAEKTWGYRSIEKTITDFHKNNSYDVGASLQGTFDPKTKNYGYVFMVGNNSTSSLLSAANANTGFYKMFYGDLWAKFLDQKLVVDIYGDYLQTAANTATVDAQSHNMFKIFAAYSFPVATIGVEAYTQQITNGVFNSVSKVNENATVNGLSVWLRGSIVPNKFGYFARYDYYNPDTKFNSQDTYTVNTNYGNYTPIVKEMFYTAGFDFTPEKNIHFMPNIWLTQYKDQRDATVAGYVANDHTLVYRMTVFYTFGK